MTQGLLREGSGKEFLDDAIRDLIGEGPDPPLWDAALMAEGWLRSGQAEGKLNVLVVVSAGGDSSDSPFWALGDTLDDTPQIPLLGVRFSDFGESQYLSSIALELGGRDVILSDHKKSELAGIGQNLAQGC